MPLPFRFDFKNPDYTEVIQWRLWNLERLRSNPEMLTGLKLYYKNNIGQFINDWGSTYDPRNVDRGLPAIIPFILFPKQEEFVEWFIDKWRNRKPGLSDKSRDMGMSWLTMAISCSLCLFYEGMAIGFGSRKQEYVDKIGDPKSLLYKGRKFIDLLPAEFTDGWEERKHSPHMRIVFPGTGSIISGEAGDGIGRGDRASVYIVDEAAFLPRPELVDASLSETTNCRIDISTPCGMANPFARKRFGGKIDVFSMHWRDDPRKDEEWYKRKCDYLDDPVVIAQELDLDYTASVTGILIPSIWVQASIDAHIKLGIDPKGVRKIGFDVADQGSDKNGVCGRYGILVEYIEGWSGKGDDIYGSVEKVFTLADILGYESVDYDADGLGAGVRGDARVINEKREEAHIRSKARSRYTNLTFNPFHGSGKVIDPEGNPFQRSDESRDHEKGRTNEDFFKNRKAQGWWGLRNRFKLTYHAIKTGEIFTPEDIISIPSSIPCRQQLLSELSQPTYSQDNAGKIIIDKTPDGARSPNLADSVMIAFAPTDTRRGFFF